MTVNKWACLTPEQRAASVAKGIETRRKNRAAREKLRFESEAGVSRLLEQAAALEKRIASLAHTERVSALSVALTGRGLLTEEQIVGGAEPWENVCGVYFLVKDRRVIYVGQSVNVFGRVASHHVGDFDSVAYVRCDKLMLDRLESLYIHVLNPPQNGDAPRGGKVSPLSIEQLLGATA